MFTGVICLQVTERLSRYGWQVQHGQSMIKLEPLSAPP